MKYLITGITGQDGIHLTDLILKRQQNPTILGTTRYSDYDSFFNKLNYLNKNFDNNNITFTSTNLENYKAVKKLILGYQPDFIFNLSGPSSVYGSYLTPEKTHISITSIFNNLSNACIELNSFCNFFSPQVQKCLKIVVQNLLLRILNFYPSLLMLKQNLKYIYQ